MKKESRVRSSTTLDSPYKAISLAAFVISSKYVEQYKSRMIHYDIQLSKERGKEREGVTGREGEREAELRIKSEVKLNQGYNSSNAFIIDKS